MKKILCVFIILLIGSVLGCKREGDILATYKDGSITRGDFYKWIEARRFTKDSVIKSKANQKDKLEKMAVELITIAKAKEAGFDKTDEIQVHRDIAAESLLMQKLYNKEIKEKAQFKEPAVRIRQILIRVKDFEVDPKQKNKRVNLSKQELEKRNAEAVAKAKEIIEKLKKGENFEQLATQHSEDFSKKKGGDIGFITRDMMPPDFTAAAFSLKEGEFTKEPVKTSTGIYIIKIEEKEELTEKNTEKIIKDKGQAMRIKSAMLRNYSKNYIDKLMGASDVKIFENKALSRNNADVLFKVGDKNFTISDLAKRIELRQFGGLGNKQKTSITDDQRKSLVKNYFQYEVLKRDAIAKGIDKDPEYMKEMQIRLDGIIAREYMEKILGKEVKVTQQEIREEYDKNKDNRYFKMINQGKNRVKQPEPFANVKDRIEKNLISTKKVENRKEWTKQILQEYNYKVDESELEGGK